MTPTPTHDDPRAAGAAPPDALRGVFRQVQRQLLVATAAIAVLGVVGGYLVAGLAGVLGALLGVLAALLFSGTTVLSMRFAVGRPPATLAAVVLGSWLVKMVLLIGLLVVIDATDVADRYVFAAVLLVVVITSMVIDVRAVVRARIPNADPPARP